jgi:hypothetical protein
MRVNLCKLCQFTTELANGGQLLITFERLIIERFPCPMPPLVLVVEFEKEMMEDRAIEPVEVVMIDEDGRELLKLPVGVHMMRSVEPISARSWLKVALGGEPTIEGPGVCRFDIYHQGRVIGAERIIFTQAQPMGHPPMGPSEI